MRHFAIGDRVRLVPRFYRRGENREFRRVRNGRVVTICEIRSCIHGKHRWFRIGNNGKRNGVQIWLRSDEVRGEDEPLLRGKHGNQRGGIRPGAGRKGKSEDSLPAIEPKKGG